MSQSAIVPSAHDNAVETAKARPIDMKLEVVVIPVSDVDHAKRFYSDLGWRLDADFVKVTPSASSSSRLLARRARSTSARV
jgi:hypothetical protein